MHDNAAEGIKFSDSELTDFHCNACIFGKVHRALIHNKSVPKCTISRQRLHWDTCSPIKPSLAKSIYMVIRVDEVTNFYFIGFCKTKNTIPQTLFDTITKIDKVRGVNTVKAIYFNRKERRKEGRGGVWLPIFVGLIAQTSYVC